jgi:hypothetical protein
VTSRVTSWAFWFLWRLSFLICDAGFPACMNSAIREKHVWSSAFSTRRHEAHERTRKGRKFLLSCAFVNFVFFVLKKRVTKCANFAVTLPGIPRGNLVQKYSGVNERRWLRESRGNGLLRALELLIMTVIDVPPSATVTRDGKKITIVLDVDLLEGLELESGTKLKVTRQGKQLVFEEAPAVSTPPTASADREKFLEGVKRSHERYADAYRKLAE